MAIDLSAIKAAADALRQQSNETPKSEPKRNQTSGAKKSAPKIDILSPLKGMRFLDTNVAATPS